MSSAAEAAAPAASSHAGHPSASSSASSSSSVDHHRYVHVDIAGGSNNFGSSTRGGSECASGGPGGTVAARQRHTQAQQAAAPHAPANRRDAKHTLCNTCHPHTAHFANNYISTTKYNLLSFLPLNLWEQFQKKANTYFLLVACISLTPLSPKTPIVSVAPLLLVLAVSAIKEALEDFQRYKMDKQINATLVDTWRSEPRDQIDSLSTGGPQTAGSGFEPVAWADVQVGDIVFVREGQAFPADLVLLQSSGAQGLAHIETSNLDGETNLKTKSAPPQCWRILVTEQQHQHKATFTAATAAAAPAGTSIPLVPRGRSRKNLSMDSFRSNGDEGLSSRSNPASRGEAAGLRWPNRLPAMVLESSAPSKKLDGAAWKANLTFLGPTQGSHTAFGAGGEGGEQHHTPGGGAAAASTAADSAPHAHTSMSLGMSQLLLRGCVLRNTKWVIGLVIFTGVDTKLMLNNRGPAVVKRSRVDRIVDHSLYMLFALEFALCTFGAIANYVWMAGRRDEMFYLPDVDNIGSEAGLSWFTYLVLLDILIPISLYVSMELVKAMQASWISRDVSMYHADTDTPAHARTSNLNEELGQVSDVFTDKTGTLTANIMQFVACEVGGNIYGTLEGEGAGGAEGQQHQSPPPPRDHPSLSPLSLPAFKGLPPLPDPNASFQDTRLVRALLTAAGSLSRPASAAQQQQQQRQQQQQHQPSASPVPSPSGSPFHGSSGSSASTRLQSRDLQVPTSSSSSSSPSPHVIDHFLTLLGVCHSVLPDFPGCMKEHVHTLDSNCKASVVYQAASPDEKALVDAARGMGYYFYHREPTQITVGGTDSSPSVLIQGEKVVLNILGQVHPFLLLDSFEFTSDRARMSVIVLDPRDGLIKLLSKGADSKMFSLLSQSSRSSPAWGRSEHALSQFAQRGLRTLVCAYKVVPEADYVAWASRYAKARTAIRGREELVRECQEEMESHLELLGSTAIEDRLQAGVPQAISTLSQAGMKLWVLTGDKVETAINIARSCSLVTPQHDAAGLLQLVVDDKLSEEDGLKATQEQLDRALSRVEAHVEAERLATGEASSSLAIIVSGQALSHIFSVVRDARGREILYEDLDNAARASADVLRNKFLSICSRCTAVVCCRVSPNQKAEVVALVKTKQPDKITLAIGDGANDVAMIRAAHVGIGISGLEGLQAVMASDYSIAQFRFLVPLLLVHGHWSYERISKLILYCFYKNVAIALTSIWFAIYSGFSAQLFYDAYAGSMYNIIFTSLPVMLCAVLDRDVSRENLVRYPALYASGPRNECFNVRLLVRVVFEGTVHSILIYFCCMCLYTGAGDVMSPSGATSDLWVFSTAAYTYIVLVVNARMAVDTSTLVWVNDAFLVASVIVWFLFALAYSALNLTPDMYMVAQQMMGALGFWVGLVVIPTMCMVPDIACRLARSMMWPTLKDVVMERERGYGHEKKETQVTSRQYEHNPKAVYPSDSHTITVASGVGTGVREAGVAQSVLVRPASPLRQHVLTERLSSIGSNSRLLTNPDNVTSSGLGVPSESDDVQAATHADLSPPPPLQMPPPAHTPRPSPSHGSPLLTSHNPSPSMMLASPLTKSGVSVHMQQSSQRRTSSSQAGNGTAVLLHLAPSDQATPPVSARRTSALHSSRPHQIPSPSLSAQPHPHHAGLFEKRRLSFAGANVTSTR